MAILMQHHIFRQQVYQEQVAIDSLGIIQSNSFSAFLFCIFAILLH